MAKLKLKLLFVCALIILMGAVPVAVGDWDPGDGHKMHYPQLPDLNDTGMDVLAGPRVVEPNMGDWYEKFLADDFQCSQSGPITDIHFWGSYNADIRLTDAPMFSLVIYENLPADACYPFSRPGAVLWDAYLEPTAERVYASDVNESFYDPNPDAIIGWDTEVWQFNFEIDPNHAHWQEEGEIYWLGVHHTFDLNGDGAVNLMDLAMLKMMWPAAYGWKTSGVEQFEDDAVWADVSTFFGDPHVVPEGEIWTPLVYPMGHDWWGYSIDLAFVITGPEAPAPKPPVEHLKWSQPPIEICPDDDEPRYCGWDEMSHNFDFNDPCGHWKIVADDFRCLGSMPITSVHWWGSHYGWNDANEPPPASNLPVAWWIGFWSNIPADPCEDPNYSYPQTLLHYFTVPAERVEVEQVGTDYYHGYHPDDVCYQYYLDLEPNEYFRQKEFEPNTIDDVFWLSIVAIHTPVTDPNEPNGGPGYEPNIAYPWGWKTRPWSWMDDAVTFNRESEPVLGPRVERVVDYTREPGDPATSWSGFRSLYVWNDTMHVGDQGFDLFGRYDGISFTYDADFGGSCIYDFEVYDKNGGDPADSELYACAWDGKVYKSSDGTTWTAIRGGQGDHSWEVEEYQGYLYVSTGPDLDRYDGASFTLVWTEPNGTEIISMTKPGGNLILGVGNEAGYGGAGGAGKVYSYDGIAVSPISNDTGGGMQVLLEFGGVLYAGGSNPGVVYEYLGGTSWQVISPPLGAAVLSLCEFEGDLYAGTLGEDWLTGGRVWRYDGAGGWMQLGGKLDDQACSLVVYQGSLYAGSAWDGGRLYKYDPGTPWGLNPWSITPIEDPLYGESYDMAFELDTDPCYIKWEQPFTGIRNWPHYEDEKSMAIEVTTAETVTKYVQPPDLSPNGVDVDATTVDDVWWAMQILADDFNCTTTEPITDIHIWGSWYWDYPFPNDVDFYLSIWSDRPVGTSGWSEPNEEQWGWWFDADNVTVSVEARDLEEGYYVPCEPYYEPLADTICYRYDFYIDPFDAFMQKGSPDEPVVYWLVVEAYPWEIGVDEPIRFGWKTSKEHWNDDAVWTDDFGDSWNELRYPAGHPYEGNSIDLAFKITGEEEETEFQIDRLVADDWPCDQNTPITAAVWWGSYIDYNYEACEGPPIDLPVKPDYFWLTIWDDVPDPNPADPNTFSHPNNVIWEYRAYDYDEVLVGYDKHPHGAPNEPVFRYSVRLPESAWFCQDSNDAVFWFSVVAVYDGNQPNYDWGWTNHAHVYNDDAVSGYLDVSSAWFWEELHDQTGASADMSFVLFTEPGCFPCAHPDYFEWLYVGKPDCWCYPRQCHGDADGLSEGKNNYWVAINDLTILKNAWAKPLGSLVGNEICADFDHLPEGKNLYRVAINDLTILKNNWAIPNGPDPNCFAGY